MPRLFFAGHQPHKFPSAGSGDEADSLGSDFEVDAEEEVKGDTAGKERKKAGLPVWQPDTLPSSIANKMMKLSFLAR